MTTVTIKIDEISAAITAMEDLSSEVTSQAAVARSASPISLPSLSESTLGKKTRWLDDHLEDLTTRRDLAILLDTEGTGTASYTVTSDTLSNVKEMLGQELASAASNIDATSDQDQLDHLAGLLETWNEDPDVMAAMFTELGPDGTVGFLANISSAMGYGGVGDPDVYTALAEDFRTGLATASNAPGFPAESFGEEIVRFSVAPLLTDEEQRAFAEEFGMGMNGANILTFLMGETNYSDDFLLGAARTLDDFERMTEDGVLSAQDWYGHNGHGPLPTGNETGWYDDPMAMIMHNFGENPEAGLTFFTESTEDGWDRQTYYFNDREWKADGYGGISHAVEGIGTSVENLTNDPEATTGLVSRFLDQVANSPGFNANDAQPASPYIADLLKFYMPAVDTALRFPNEDGAGGSTSLTIDNFGSFDHYPILFTDDLDSLMQVSMSTPEGMQRIAEGVGVYQQTQINNIAAALEANPDDPDLRMQLRDVLQRSAALQGFGEYSVGQVEIDGAEDRDAQRQAFIDLVSDATSLVPLPGADVVGEFGSDLIDFGFSQAVDLGTDAAGNAFTSEGAAATDNANDRAAAGTNRVKITAYLALVESGVIPRDEVPDSFFQNGRLISAADIPPDQMSSYAQTAMSGVSSYASNNDLEGPYRDEFLEYYGPAGE
ncbi:MULTISPECIES: DUF6571 family protein [unclassified Aeromicrobium]|uniref:DUF6571 family protein n=1 Tax=unclassified Aeromicrobium TaxID=2633570 RepID=UPI00396B1C84